jgi:hypothetical protein
LPLWDSAKRHARVGGPESQLDESAENADVLGRAGARRLSGYGVLERTRG